MGSNYYSIKDAIGLVGRGVTIAGVIVECGLPQKSSGRGWDLFCSLKIKDESYHDDNLTVCVFGKEIDQLPRVQSVGDIVYFHHVVMQNGGGKISAGFNKLVSSFALFEGKSGHNCIPYDVSTNYRPNRLNQDIIISLRRWLLTWQLDSGGLFPITPLKDVRAGVPFDIICKIVKVQYEATLDQWVLYLWDGTDAPSISFPSNWNAEFKDPKLLHVEGSSLPKDVLCGFPSVGTVISVVFRGERMIGSRLSCGWVRFINLSCEERYGLWYGIWSSKTKVNILSEEDVTVTSCKRAYEERVLKSGGLPLSALPRDSHISERSRKKKSFVTLRNVLTHSQAPCKFKCLVRIVAIYPDTVQGLWSALNSKSRIGVIIEDPTARIRTSLPADYKVRFFGGCSSLDEFTHKFNELLGIPEGDGIQQAGALRNPPWTVLGLKDDKTGPQPTKKRKISDTTRVV